MFDNESKIIIAHITYLVVILRFIEIILITHCLIMTRKASLIIGCVTVEIIRAWAGCHCFSNDNFLAQMIAFFTTWT